MSGAGIVISRPSATTDKKGHGLIRTGNRKGHPTISKCLYGEDYVESETAARLHYGLFLPQVNAMIYRCKIIL
jgi:hypothetical protein